MSTAAFVVLVLVVLLLMYLSFMFGAGKSFREGLLADDGSTRQVQASSMRRFIVQRDDDVSGVSGTGPVCEGVRFSDGHVAIHWTWSKYPWTTPVPDGIDGVLDVHGHGGRTWVSWVDEA